MKYHGQSIDPFQKSIRFEVTTKETGQTNKPRVLLNTFRFEGGLEASARA